MKISRFFSSKTKAPRKQTGVKQVARFAIKKYEKTFIDLARYDRGEKPSVSVSK